jgi:MFS family permease
VSHEPYMLSNCIGRIGIGADQLDFITLHTGLDPNTTSSTDFTLPAWQKSLITSVLSAGTFFGALAAGDLADGIGRRWTIISGCAVFCVGNVLQTASSDGLGLVSLPA